MEQLSWKPIFMLVTDLIFCNTDFYFKQVFLKMSEISGSSASTSLRVTILYSGVLSSIGKVISLLKYTTALGLMNKSTA